MKKFRLMRTISRWCFAIIFILTTVLAQLISLKTVPVATGDQFLIFPSQNLGMGSVSIALEDSLLDPFINPAKGTYINGSQMISSPVFYSFSNNDGTVRTLPLGVMLSSSKWFAGLFVAIQQLEVINPNNFRFGLSRPRLLSDNSASNIYSFGLLGKRFPHANLSIAGSMFWASLDALDGVDLLYVRSQKIDQSGYIADYRIGLFGELNGERSYEILFLFNELDMTHNVTYVEWIWDIQKGSSRVTRVEKNLDHTQTWGIHTRYVQPIGKDGFRAGGILTINRKSHPKIPNYEIMNIPRDPGNTWAYNVGVGVSMMEDMAAFGIDLIYEPIWSNTWANTDTAIETESGKIIPAGGKTVENDFEFANWLIRVGLRQENNRFGLQLGLQMKSYRYWLEQENNIEESHRTQNEHWLEWVPSWGITLKFPGFQLRYMGRTTTGTGRPGVEQQNWGWMIEDGWMVTTGADFIIAPSGPLTLEEARVTTHQITVSVPLNR
ncbi:MAG: hypothetical protein IID16_07835 [Candidatus Marinimicrobia bacterium]|nr:hypothetical protein [Candidatus Neomarinimicrobiota bacterium]